MIMVNTAHFRQLSANVILILSISALTACGSTPVKVPHNKDISILGNGALNIDTIAPTNIKVAASKSWQSSGTFLENGERIKVTAHGKWSPAPLMLQWSGGEGSTFYGAEIPYITGGALMAKLGHDGIPFEIGIDKTFRANDYGMLYFAMNDPFKWQYDNEGELDVAIYTSLNKSERNTANSKPIEIVAYSYDDRTGVGSLSSRVTGDHFQTRNWMISKIGEISSSKRVALRAGKESLQGGNYKVRDESTKDGILTIKFETLW